MKLLVKKKPPLGFKKCGEFLDKPRN